MMKLEQRGNKRLPLKLNVTLNYGPVGLVQAEASNISLGGMFLETPSTAQMRIDTPIDIGFKVQASEKAMHKLNAQVVRVSQDGLGVVFRDYDLDAMQALTQMMGTASEDVVN